MSRRLSWYRQPKEEPSDPYKAEMIINNMATEIFENLIKNNTDFRDKKVITIYDDLGIWYVIHREGLIVIIKEMIERIRNMFSELVQEDFDNKEANYERYQFLDNLRRTWGNPHSEKCNHIDMWLTEDYVSGSNQYQYCIFDLIYLFKHFDFNKYNLILYIQ